MEEFIVSGIAILFILLILTLFVVKHRNKKRANSLQIGMSESDLLKLLGGYTSKSVLKDGTVKYVKKWANASSSSYKGIRVYQGVQKTTVWVKDGVVTHYDNNNI